MLGSVLNRGFWVRFGLGMRGFWLDFKRVQRCFRGFNWGCLELYGVDWVSVWV